MLFVFLSHFGYAYFGASESAPQEIIAAVSMVASPTFVLISGFMLGFLYRTRRQCFGQMRDRLIDRGIFLLTIGHALILLAHQSLHASWRWGFITDAIGFSMIAGALLVDRLKPSRRLLLSAAVYGSAWGVMTFWRPESALLQFFEETLVGTVGDRHYIYNFPILPWFSLYFASSVIGERIGAYHQAGRETSARRMFAYLSVVSTAVAIVGLVVSLVVISERPEFSAAERARRHSTLVDDGFRAALVLVDPTASAGPALGLTSPFQKRPPGPVFLALYGGAGALILYGCLELERRKRGRRMLAWIAILGRASLFAFVAQYFAYYTVLHRLAPRVSPWWPIPFAASALLLTFGAALWSRWGGNQYISVGYPAIAAHLAQRWSPPRLPYAGTPADLRRRGFDRLRP